MKKILLGLATVGMFSAISFSACGGGDNCSAKSSCSADVALTDAEIKTCQDNAAKVTVCKAEIDAEGSCYNSNRKCGTDNKTDLTATGTAYTTNCASQISAYNACIAKNATVDAGSTSKDGG